MEAELRIVHVVRQFYPARGGMEAVVEAMALGQCDIGASVTVITLNRLFGSGEKLLPFETLGKVQIIRVPFWGSQRYPIAPSVLKHVRGADIIHVHGIDFFFDFLAITSVFHKKSLVVSTHGAFFHTKYAESLKRLFFLTVTRFSLTRYAFVAASSESDLSLFRRIRTRGLGLYQNGVDTNKFSGIKREGAPKQIIYFGRLAPHKNIDKLFSLLASLRRVDPAWRLVIAGRPIDKAIADLDASAARWNQSGAVRIIASPTDECLRTEIAASSVYCSASSYEGFGIAAIEAISGGLLPVLSNIVAHKQTIAATDCGITINYDETEAEVERVLSEWKRFTDNVEEADLSSYSWANVIKSFAELYEKVLGRNSRQIGACKINVLEARQALEVVASSVRHRSTLRLAFVNAHLANIASRSDAFEEMLDAFFLLNDGIGIDLASKVLYGGFFPANLNGTDFTPKLIDQLDAGQRIYILGATQKVIEMAAQYYEKRWPQHTLVGFSHGFFSKDDEVKLAALIRETAPTIILVGMGSPRQEEWMHRYIPDVCPVGLGVGALFDFQTDAKMRAPEILRRAKLEWVFRLVLEPRRLWRRYLVGNLMFLKHLASQFIRGERA